VRAIFSRPETLGADELELHLIAALDDAPSWEPEYQGELFYVNHRLAAGGVEYSCLVEGPGCKGPVEAAALGELFIKFTEHAVPVIGTVVGAWLHSKYGRKVRLKVGDIDAEAQTPEEVQGLLERAQEFQQRNQRKLIHEP
jgi:hypothetical protein